MIVLAAMAVALPALIAYAMLAWRKAGGGAAAAAGACVVVSDDDGLVRQRHTDAGHPRAPMPTCSEPAVHGATGSTSNQAQRAEQRLMKRLALRQQQHIHGPPCGAASADEVAPQPRISAPTAAVAAVPRRSVMYRRAPSAPRTFTIVIHVTLRDGSASKDLASAMRDLVQRALQLSAAAGSAPRVLSWVELCQCP